MFTYLCHRKFMHISDKIKLCYKVGFSQIISHIIMNTLQSKIWTNSLIQTCFLDKFIQTFWYFYLVSFYLSCKHLIVEKGKVRHMSASMSFAYMLWLLSWCFVRCWTEAVADSDFFTAFVLFSSYLIALFSINMKAFTFLICILICPV